MTHAQQNASHSRVLLGESTQIPRIYMHLPQLNDRFSLGPCHQVPPEKKAHAAEKARQAFDGISERPRQLLIFGKELIRGEKARF